MPVCSHDVGSTKSNIPATCTRGQKEAEEEVSERGTGWHSQENCHDT
jgi:hypothetical protein